MYIKDGDKIYRVVTTRTEVDLEALKGELARLKALERPTDEELIEIGKDFHEYYEGRENNIAFLEKKIAEIEKAVLKVEYGDFL